MRASVRLRLVVILTVARSAFPARPAQSRSLRCPTIRPPSPPMATPTGQSWSDDLSRRQMESVEWEYKPPSPQRRFSS